MTVEFGVLLPTREAVMSARPETGPILVVRKISQRSSSRPLQVHDQTAEARRQLTEIYGWFAEGFDTADLQEANAFLDEP